MNSTDFGKRYKETWDKLRKENPRPVILVTGATGAGKSTLINLVMGRDVAKVGAGRPETQNMDRFENDLLVIYDSKGYEAGETSQNEFFHDISDFLKDKAENPLTAVNIVWHCISAPAARVLDVDTRLLDAYKADHIPAAVILTQVDTVDEDQINELTAVLNKHSSTTPIFWSTEDRELQKELPKDKGLEELYQWSLEHMDVTRREAFRAGCNRDLSAKREKGRNAALATAASAFAIGFVPVPAADAPALVATQTAMLGRISYIWGVNFMTALQAAGGLDLVMVQLGRMVAGNIIKLFPGLGSMIGGLINASVAASLTYGLGMAVNEICYQSCLAELEGKPSPLADLFTSENLLELIKKYKDEYHEDKTSRE